MVGKDGKKCEITKIDHSKSFWISLVGKDGKKCEPNLDKFFEGCEIPPYVLRNAQEDSKIEHAEVAEYSVIEQAVCIWWLSNNKPLYWKIEHLQASFENLNIGNIFRFMLERHPQMYPHTAGSA